MPNNVTETGTPPAEGRRIPETRYSREQVVSAFNDAKAALSSTPDDQLSTQEKWQKKTLQEAETKVNFTEGKDTFENKFQERIDNTEVVQQEGIPVEELIQFARKKAREAPKDSDDSKKWREIANILHKNSKTYRQSHGGNLVRTEGRILQESHIISQDVRNTGNDLTNYFAAARIIGPGGTRRELVLPPTETPTEPAPPAPAPTPAGPEPASKTSPGVTAVSDVVREFALLSRNQDIDRRAREMAEVQLRNEMRWGRNPLGWLRKIGLRVGEEYYRQLYIQRARRAIVQSNNTFLGMDVVRNSAIDANNNRNLYEQAAKAKTEQAKQLQALSEQAGEQFAGQRTKVAEGELKTLMTNNLIKPIVERLQRGENIQDTEVQQMLRDFISSNQGGADIAQQLNEFFGSTSGRSGGRTAELFATDLVEMAKLVKTDLDAHKYAVDALSNHVKITMGDLSWAAEGEANLTRWSDKVVEWAQKGSRRGWLINPATVGIAFSLATLAVRKIPTALTRAIPVTAVPVVGTLFGAAFAAFRRNRDLKIDMASHRVERAYNMQIPPREAPRREALERRAYNTRSVDGLLNGDPNAPDGHPARVGLRELVNRNLTDGQDQNRNELLSRIAEIKARLDFSSLNKVDLVTFTGREQVEQGRLELLRAMLEARNKLRAEMVAGGMTNDKAKDEIKRLETQHTGDWNSRFINNKNQQDRAFFKYRMRNAAGSTLFAATVGVAGGLVGQELLAQISRHASDNVLNAPVIGGILQAMKGETSFEKMFNAGKTAFGGERVNFAGVVGGGLGVDALKNLYDHPTNVTIPGKNMWLAVDFNHHASLLDGSNNPLPTPPMEISKDGHLMVLGKMDAVPQPVKDFLKASGWAEKLTSDPSFSLQEKMAHAYKMGTAGHETFRYGNFNIDLESGANHQMSMSLNPGTASEIRVHGFLEMDATGKPNLNIDGSFNGNQSLDRNQLSLLKSELAKSGWPDPVINPVHIPGKDQIVQVNEYLKSQGAMQPTARELWHDNQTPMRFVNGRWLGADGKELQFYHRITPDGKIEMDFSKMESNFQNGAWRNWDYTADNQYNRVVNDIVRQPDGSRVFNNFEIMVTPNEQANALREAVVFNASNHPELKQGFLRFNLDSPEARAFFKLDENGKPVFNKFGNFQGASYIEVSHKQANNLRTVLSTTQGDGVTQTIIPGKDIDYEVYHISAPPATELIPPHEGSPVIPIPFAPRHPLEEMQAPPKRREEPLPGYGYGEPGGSLGWIEREDYKARRSETLNRDPAAKLDESKEIADYFSRLDPKYVKELQEMDRLIGEPMSPETKIAVTIPTFHEGKIIRETLEQYLNQKDRNGNPINPNLFEIIVYENDNASMPKDNTEEEVRKFTTDHPEVKVRYSYKRWSQEDIANGVATIGNGRKYDCDLALLRSNRRPSKSGDLVIVNNDADLEGISPRYISDIVEEFDSKENLDVVVGKRDLPDWALKKPNIRAGQRLWEMFDAVMRRDAGKGIAPSERIKGWPGMIGENSAMRAAIYAAVGGYAPTAKLSEDQNLGDMIRVARNFDDSRFQYVNRLETIKSPRRYLSAIASGTPLYHMYGDYHENKELRDLDNDRLLDLIPNNFDKNIFQKDVDAIWQAKNKFAYIGGDRFDAAFARVMGFMGVGYRIENNHIIITDTSSLEAGLNTPVAS